MELSHNERTEENDLKVFWWCNRKLRKTLCLCDLVSFAYSSCSLLTLWGVADWWVTGEQIKAPPDEVHLVPPPFLCLNFSKTTDMLPSLNVQCCSANLTLSLSSNPPPPLSQITIPGPRISAQLLFPLIIRLTSLLKPPIIVVCEWLYLHC